MKSVAKIAAALLLGGSTVAIAQPVPLDRERGVDERVHDQGDRALAGWVPVADHYSANGDHQFVTVEPNAGRFHRLRIEAERGRPYLRNIDVRFADGTVQRIQLGRMLRPGESTVMTLDGGERQIASILVRTQPDARAAYSIMAER